MIITGVQKALSVLPQDEVGLVIVKTGVGPIAEGDIGAAKASNAHVVGFNVKATPLVHELARKRGVSIIEQKVVYSIVDAVTAMMSEKLPPRMVLDVMGEAKVREVFEINKGTRKASAVAGCLVVDGLLRKNSMAQVLRGEEVVHEGKIESLRSFKSAVPEVKKGAECGIVFPDFSDFKPGDIIRCINKRAVKRKLGEKL